MTEGSEPYFWSHRRWWGRMGKTSIAIWGSTAFGLVGGILAARSLGPSDYGAAVLAIAAASFVTIFLDLNLTDGVVYYGIRALGADDRGNLRSLLRTAFLFDLTVGVVVAGAIVGLAGPIANVASGGEIEPSLIRIAALIGLVTTVDSTTQGVLQIVRRADLLGWTTAVANVTRVLAIVVAVLFTSGPAPIVAAYVVGALAGSLVQLWLARRVGWSGWSRAPFTRRAREWLRPLARFGIYASLTTSFQSSEKALVPIILGAFSGPAAAGIYNVALLPVTAVLVLVQPLRLMLFPEQARLAAKGDVSALRTTVRGVTRIGFMIGIPGAIAAWFLLPTIIPALYSDSFEAALEPARIMLGAAVFQFAIGSWSKILPVAIGMPRLRSIMSAAYMVVSVGLSVLLVPSLDSTGAAIGTTAAAISTSIAWWFLAKRLLARRLPPGGERVVDLHRPASIMDG